jgi:hypothetical protein
VSGVYFDGREETAPHPQAGDHRMRDWLWKASERLTGARAD